MSCVAKTGLDWIVKEVLLRMFVIGINNGHNASIAVAYDGEIVFAINEERLRNEKNYFGFPVRSLAYCYENIVKPQDVDVYAFNYESFDEFYLISMDSNPAQYTIYEKWRRKLIGYLSAIFSYNFGYWLFREVERIFVTTGRMRAVYAKKYGISKDKIVLINHHLAHASTASFNLEPCKDWLIFTADAEGDLECGTVYKKSGVNLEKLTSIHCNHSLGYLYYFVTRYMGMKPNEHEYKVMGLEPYARKNTLEFERVFNKIFGLFYFFNDNYFSKIPMKSNRFQEKWLHRALKYERFDYIAAATQKTVEVVIMKWVENWMKRTGIRNIAFSGGLFMNVKLNQRLSELTDVENIYFVPSSGDESTPLGLCNVVNVTKTGSELQPLRHLYLGNEYTAEEIKIFVTSIDPVKYSVEHLGSAINAKIAKLLADGKVVARFAGKLEFGARALGNRSILAHPGYEETIRIINEMIKDRDFWMPFSPSVIEEDAGSFINNPRANYAPYMNLTFNSTDFAQNKIKAAIHPSDKTVRIQMVRQEWNPDYYDLLKQFKSITGIGALLNTSFNLHGKPNVGTPENCIETLEKSQLRFLVLHDYLITKISR